MNELRRVLLVEDDPTDLQMTLNAIRTMSMERIVNVASTGEEALEFLFRQGKHAQRPEWHPALVLLDIKLPLVSGIDVLRAIKANEALQQIPVVILTSSCEASDVDECYRLGANAYVVKPMDLPDYMSSVKDIFQFWTARNQPPRACVD